MKKGYLELFRKGASVAGAGAGAVAGSFLAPGPGTVAGAAVGAAVGEVTKLVLDDVASRVLSTREKVRIGGTAALAISQIAEDLHWKEVRGDDFFEVKDGAPSPAEELFEGVLLAAKQEHEQLKLPYLANFYTNLAFDASVKAPEANHLLTLAESLTYRQLCLLSLIDQKAGYSVRNQLWPESGTIPAESLDVAQQSYYLIQRQLLLSYNKEEHRAVFVLDVTRVLPSNVVLSSTGKRLVNLMGLQKIEKAELTALASIW